MKIDQVTVAYRGMWKADDQLTKAYRAGNKERVNLLFDLHNGYAVLFQSTPPTSKYGTWLQLEYAAAFIDNMEPQEMEAVATNIRATALCVRRRGWAQEEIELVRALAASLADSDTDEGPQAAALLRVALSGTAN